MITVKSHERRRLTFLSLAAEVELGLLGRYNEKQDGHKDGHCGVSDITTRGSTGKELSDRHTTNLPRPALPYLNAPSGGNGL